VRAFLCAVIIFGVMIALISANAVFTARYSDELIRMTDSLPKESTKGAQEIIDSIREYFSKKEFLIMATNNHSKVYEIYKIISQLQAAIIADDFALYSQSRLALYDAVRVLSEFNRVSFLEIF